MDKKKVIGRPRNKVRRVKSGFALMPHTVLTLMKLSEETGRTKSDIIDLAVDRYLEQFMVKPENENSDLKSHRHSK